MGGTARDRMRNEREKMTNEREKKWEMRERKNEKWEREEMRNEREKMWNEREKMRNEKEKVEMKKKRRNEILQQKQLRNFTVLYEEVWLKLKQEVWGRKDSGGEWRWVDRHES